MSSKRKSGRLLKQASENSNASSPAETGSNTTSAPASPGEQSKSQIDFQFLNFSHPSEAKTGKTRKAVRSHVTKQQHQRESAAAAARRANTSRPALSEETPLALRTHSAMRPALSPSTDTPERASSTTDHSEMSSPSVSPSVSPIYPLQRRLDPTEVYPEEWHPYIARMMEHYLSNLAVDVPELDGPEAAGLLRTRFFPFVMTDPASMHAIMLIAASHYERARGSRSHTIDLLQLRGMAIREINSALEDDNRAISDQLIAAVAEMATFEALFGDPSIFNTHMTGLLRMVSLRGGLPALGLDGLLERLLLWIDMNTAHILRSRIYFDKAAFPTSAVHPRPDPARFSGGLA